MTLRARWMSHLAGCMRRDASHIRLDAFCDRFPILCTSYYPRCHTAQQGVMHHAMHTPSCTCLMIHASSWRLKVEVHPNTRKHALSVLPGVFDPTCNAQCLIRLCFVLSGTRTKTCKESLCCVCLPPRIVHVLFPPWVPNKQIGVVSISYSISIPIQQTNLREMFTWCSLEQT